MGHLWSWMSVWHSVGGSILLSFVVMVMMHLLVARRKKKSNLPPGPPGWPIVGNLLHLGKKPNESLFLLAQKYGPLMTLQLGMKTTVVVSSPAMAKEVLKNKDQQFAYRTVIQAAKCASYSDGSVVWSQYGPRWRMLRRICTTELFAAKRLEELQHLRRDQVFNTIRQIYQDFLEGKKVNMGHTAFLTSLNVVGNMLFAQNVFHRDSEAAGEFKQTIAKLMVLAGTPNLADFFPFLQFLDPQGISRATTKYVNRVYALFDKFIEDRVASSSEHRINGAEAKDFLDILLDHRSDDADGESIRFTKTDMKALLFDMFIAGSETSGTTIEWAMAELIRSPHTMKRAQAELEDVVGRHRKVEETDIQHLPYLHAVVKEVFRLHPAIPLLIPHRVETHCEIAGFEIPGDSQVIVNAWGIGRDPNVWSHPLDFCPDRFLHSDIDYKGHNFELIPFGAGRRICAGLPLAHRMVQFILASLLHSFDWGLPHGTKLEQMDMSDRFGITLQKDLPVYAIPTPRLPSNIY